LIQGAPGIGKSDIVAQATKAAEAELIISHPVVSDPTDYKGLPMPSLDGKHADFLPFGDLNKLIEAKEPTVFFLDDLGQAPAAVQAACMQLILAREINGKKISDEITFIAATNRRQDKAGVMGILEPVKSRFAAILSLDVNLEDWVTWAMAHSMPHELISFIRFRPNLLDMFEPTGDIRNSPCPRTVSYVGKMYNAGMLNDKKTRAALIEGAAGDGFSAEFSAYLDTYSRIPAVSSMIADPKGTEVPTEPSMQYAICGAIAAKADINNFDKLIIYIDRLPKEFQVLAVKDSVKRKMAISGTTGFIKWVNANQSVVL
jgi:hypothetical protein